MGVEAVEDGFAMKDMTAGDGGRGPVVVVAACDCVSNLARSTADEARLSHHPIDPLIFRGHIGYYRGYVLTCVAG